MKITAIPSLVRGHNGRRVTHTAVADWYRPQLNIYAWLGIVLGVVMPVLSAVIYPTYMHQMQPEWVEWTRLMELPFVACELVIIHVAISKGYRDQLVWNRLPKDVVAALGLLMLGLVFSSAFTSKNPAASITLSITTIVHLRFGAAVFFMARTARTNQIRVFFAWLGAGLVALTIITAWRFMRPPPAWSVIGGTIEWASALPGFINVRHFGSWTGAIASGALIALLYGKSHQRRGAGLLYLLAAGLTCWSGTRAAILAMVVVTLIALFSLGRFPDRRSTLHVAALSALALLGAIAVAPHQPAFSLFMRDNMQTADGLTSGRVVLWQLTLARWWQAPLFGWGSGSTFWEVNAGWHHTQPHNAVVQFLISWGMVGTTGALWLLGRTIIAIHRTGMADAALRPLTATLYALLFMSLLEGMLYYPRFVMLIMLSFAVLLAARDRRLSTSADACGEIGPAPGERLANL
jgi:exopolysaccharide production protein ExoQ